MIQDNESNVNSGNYEPAEVVDLTTNSMLEEYHENQIRLDIHARSNSINVRHRRRRLKRNARAIEDDDTQNIERDPFIQVTSNELVPNVITRSHSRRSSGRGSINRGSNRNSGRGCGSRRSNHH
jgi:hypothetical protein